VSAEEIIRDRKILKREKFLNLSRSSYLLSKIKVQFLISAIQTFSFIIIGNTIFGIKDMLFDYWLILFSVSCFSNLVGLNISSAFDSVVTIYILIPFLIIPQIILSGVMVKFENLNPKVTSQSAVPVIGEIMASRWAFEALAVNQFKNNRYEKNFFEYDKEMSNATLKKDFWLLKMNDKLDSLKTPHLNPPQKGGLTNTQANIALIRNELKKELLSDKNLNSKTVIETAQWDASKYIETKNYLEGLKKYYIRKYNTASAKKDSVVRTISQKSNISLSRLKDDYTNESLKDLVANPFEILFVQNKDEFILKYQPVFMDGAFNSFVRAPFYVSRKNVFGNYYSTYLINFIVIWAMSFLLAITLYFDVLKKLMKSGDYLIEKLK